LGGPGIAPQQKTKRILINRKRIRTSPDLQKMSALGKKLGFGGSPFLTEGEGINGKRHRGREPKRANQSRGREGAPYVGLMEEKNALPRKEKELRWFC